MRLVQYYVPVFFITSLIFHLMSTADHDFKMKFGKKVESLRNTKEYGVREFALLAEIEHHQLINIEKGRVDLRLSTIVKISKALGISPKELLDF